MLATIKLGEIADLQDEVERLWDQGEQTIGLEGTYSPAGEIDSVLRITRKLSGIAFMGVGSGTWIKGAGKASHIIVIDDADVTIRGLSIFGGNTTEPLKLARHYKGPRCRSAYEAMDGAGMLITGESNVKIENTVFGHNHSGMCGGAISNQSTGLVQITNCEFVENTAYHTGAAVDNLTPGAKVVIHRSFFQNNRSNQGSICGGPHGQVTIFPRTKAVIRHSTFVGPGLLAIDAARGASITALSNRHNSHSVEPVAPAGEGTFTQRARHFGRLVAYDLPLLLLYGLYPWVRR